MRGEPSGSAGFEIPGAPPPAPAADSSGAAAQRGGQAAPEKKMSLLYLLQHANKDNIAAYRAQLGKAPKLPKQPKSSDGPNSPGIQGAAEGALAGGLPGDQVIRPAGAVPGMAGLYERNGQQQAPSGSALSAPGAQPRQPQTGDEGTVFLEESAPQRALRPCLLRKKTGEQVEIGKAVFRIGKQQQYVDYCITDNKAVSRAHAVVFQRDGQYFVTDTNSANHTYVNGQIVQPNEEAPIAPGAILRLADEEFEFRFV
jgi:hypothetical protein